MVSLTPTPPIHLQMGWEPIAVLWGGLLHSSLTPTPSIHPSPAGVGAHSSAMGKFVPQQLTPTPSIHPSPAGVGTHSSAMGRFAPQQPHSHPIITIIITHIQQWWDQTQWSDMVDQLPLLQLEQLAVRAQQVDNKVETPTFTDMKKVEIQIDRQIDR